MDKYFPFEIKELTLEQKATVKRAFGRDIDYVSIGPKQYKFLRPYAEEAANIYNMPVRPSDVFVATFQRSGTTLVQELIWLLSNNVDMSTANNKLLTERYDFLEMFMFFPKKWQENFINKAYNKDEAIKVADDIGTPVTRKLLLVPSPRFIKTHAPMSLLPPNLLHTAKTVYVARDPRDVAVSSYFHSKLFQVLDFPNPFKDFWDIFVKDLFTETPYFEHVKEAWALRDHPNMLFLFYEEVVKDLPGTIRRVADFLDKKVTSEQMVQICDHLNFDNFKKNDYVNFEDLRPSGVLAPDEIFIRKGKSGGWRGYFDEEMTQQAERWIADNLRDTDLRFPSMTN